jgi:hypothetical protein
MNFQSSMEAGCEINKIEEQASLQLSALAEVSDSLQTAAGQPTFTLVGHKVACLSPSTSRHDYCPLLSFPAEAVP